MTYQKIINEKVKKLKAIDFTNILKKNCMLIDVKLLYFIIIHKDDCEKSIIEEIDQVLCEKSGVYFIDPISINDYAIFAVFNKHYEWSNMYIDVCLEILCNYGILYKLSNYNLVDNFIESLNVEINELNKSAKYNLVNNFIRSLSVDIKSDEHIESIQEKIFHNWSKHLVEKYIRENFTTDYVVPDNRYYHFLKELIVVIDKH